MVIGFCFKWFRRVFLRGLFEIKIVGRFYFVVWVFGYDNFVVKMFWLRV